MGTKPNDGASRCRNGSWTSRECSESCATPSSRSNGHARMIPRAQQNHTNRNFHAAVDRSGHLARIFVPGMGHQARLRANLSVLGSRGEKRIEFLVQPRGLAGIKAAGDSRWANHVEPLWLRAIWKACR